MRLRGGKSAAGGAVHGLAGGAEGPADARTMLCLCRRLRGAGEHWVRPACHGLHSFNASLNWSLHAGSTA